MILSQRQLEEIAASTTKDFNRFFFGDEADKPDRSALPTPIDQFAKNYLGLRVSFARLSPDGSICGVTAYADTEYKITELGITRTLALKRIGRLATHLFRSRQLHSPAVFQNTSHANA